MQTASYRADAGLGIIGSPSPDSDFYYGAGLGYRSGAGPLVSPGAATRLSAVFACIRVISETYGSLPIRIMRERKSGGIEPAKDHPAMELLAQPNPWQTAMELMETTQVHEELRGNAYWLKVPGNGRAIDQVVPLHPDRVKVYLLPNNRLRYEVTAYSTGHIDKYTQDEIVHFRGCFSYDGIMGTSMVSAMAEVIGVGLAQQEHRGRYFRNSAIPGLAIEGPKLKPESETLLKESLAEGFSGDNSFKAMVVPPGMSVKPLGLTNKDSQLIEASNATRTEICAATRVPPHKIADLTRGTFSNIEQQNIEFATDCMRPRVVRNESRFNRDVVDALRAYESAAGEYFSAVDMDALYRGDMKSRYEAYAMAIAAGWMIRNEARGSEGKNAIPGLDAPLVAVNMETVEQAQKRSDANIAAANASADAAASSSAKSGENDDQDNFNRSGGSSETPNDGDEDEENEKAQAGTKTARLRAILTANAGRIVRREVKTLRRLAQKAHGPEGKDDGPAIEGEITAFYLDLAPMIAESMAISKSEAQQYCTLHAALVATSKAALLDMAIDSIEESAPDLARLAMQR